MPDFVANQQFTNLIEARIMAREEQDREDLLREAVALVERFEIELAGGRRVVVGFRADGCASVYLDGDPAWHFNTRGELRRAFVDGFLYKAERGQLVRLERRRSADAVELVRHACTADETAALVARLAEELTALARVLAAGKYRLMGQVPDDGAVVERTRDWMATLPRPIEVAAGPRAG
jgi:hypothetical protein